MARHDRFLHIQGVRIPSLIYGTAWKEHDTERLTRLALAAGFRGVDTANQRKHYHEAGAGAGIAAALREMGLARADLFLQTKFTYIDGQDERLPYDRDAPVRRQVAQSCATSLTHLGVDVIDSYVLHGPARRQGITDMDWEAWSAMEGLQREGTARLLGVSNVTLDQLHELYRGASVKPAVVQNRCYAITGWDRDVRAFCREHGLLYQGFSLLTANPDVLRHRRLAQIASRVQGTAAQVIFRFALQVGMAALTGTTSPEHMRQDLAVMDFELQTHEVEEIERLMG